MSTETFIRNTTRTFRRKFIFERTQDVALLFNKVRQDLLLEQHRRERERDLLVYHIEISADVPRGRRRRVWHLMDKRNVERLQPRRRSRRWRLLLLPLALILQRRVKLRGRREVLVARQAALPRAATPAHVLLLPSEPPRAVRVGAHGVSDEEKVVNGECELLVAQSALWQEQAREELGGVPEQRAVLVLQRRVRQRVVQVVVMVMMMMVMVVMVVVHRAGAFFGRRGTPRGRRVRRGAREGVRAVSRGAGPLPDVLPFVLLCVLGRERVSVVEHAFFEVG